MDDKCKSMFTYTDCIPLVHYSGLLIHSSLWMVCSSIPLCGWSAHPFLSVGGLLIHSSLWVVSSDLCLQVLKLTLEAPGDRPDIELMALAINLACNKRNAQILCQANQGKTTGMSAVPTVSIPVGHCYWLGDHSSWPSLCA